MKLSFYLQEITRMHDIYNRRNIRDYSLQLAIYNQKAMKGGGELN